MSPFLEIFRYRTNNLPRATRPNSPSFLGNLVAGFRHALLAARTHFRVIAAALVAAVAGMQIRHFILWSAEELAARGMLADDAYFYSAIARNFWEFGSLTLDGTMTTNGVQPLWMIVQIVLVKIFSQVDEVRILSCSLWAVYVLFAFLAAWYACRKTILSSLVAIAILCGLLILNVRFHDMILLGLEVPLALSLIVLTMLQVDRLECQYETGGSTADRSSCVALALWASACFLARTDLFWIAPMAGVWLYSKEKGLSANISSYLGISALVILPYLAFNLITQDSIVPISGRVKQFYLHTHYPDLSSYLNSEEWKGLFLAFTQYLPMLSSLSIRECVVFTVVSSTLVVYLMSRLVDREIFSPGLIGLTVAVVCHAFFMQLAYRELRPYARYYFAPEVLWFILVTSRMAADFHPTFRLRPATPSLAARGVILSTIACMIAAGSLIFAARQWVYKEYPIIPYWSQRIKLAGDFSDTVPGDAKVGAFWPGAFAQFGDRPVTPLDGVAGSNRYFQEFVKTGREYQYMRENDISYIAIFLFEPPLELFEKAEPQVRKWSFASVQRIWDMQEHFEEVVSFRGTSEAGAGWFLLKFRL